jgi:hypothetical protein
MPSLRGLQPKDFGALKHEGILDNSTYALFADHFRPSPANLLGYVRNDICKKCVS